MSEAQFWAAEKYSTSDPRHAVWVGDLWHCGGDNVDLVSPSENRDKVETYLAFGASRYEACKPIAISAIKLALTPTINQMSVIGIIYIPGTMTGAILGGASVDQAAKLQMIIMFMINGKSNGMLAALSRAVDENCRVRSDRIFSDKFILWRARDRAIQGVVGAGKAGYQQLRRPRHHSSGNGSGERTPLLG
ncbi:hypothetical protein CTheo_7924 [Ceratobasidium theobromae]|uniref:Uncharacterized protein n=1 Tax=Ceratobasidium theobromae TaxID=1582974 RepID=A0A5N5QA10_9AGAM|nr:hypothetical protein CTheo_7924 [Ceratobasidium theobromae]